jgi:PAS domain S-box-containing protein
VSINGKLIRDENNKHLRIEGTFRDIQKRKLAEDNLKEREVLLKATIESTADGILVVDVDGKVILSNTNFAKMWNIPKNLLEQNEDKKLLDYVLSQIVDPDAFISKVMELYKSDKEDVDYIRFLDGKIFERYSYPLYKKNSLSGRVWSFRDITSLKKAELIQSTLFRISDATNKAGNLKELLKDIHNILGELIDTTNFYVALYNKKQGLYSFPYNVDEYDGSDFPPEQLRKSLTDYVRRTKKPLLADSNTHQKLMELGEVDIIGEPSAIWLGVPLIIKDNAIGVVAVQDYTDHEKYSKSDLELLSFVSEHIASAIEKKRTELQLEIEKAYLEQLFESAPEAIVVVSVDGKIIKVNNGFNKLFGFTSVEANNKYIDELIAPEFLMGEANSLSNRVSSGEICSCETKRKHKNGELIDVSILATPIRIKGGQVAIYAIYRDIRDRKNAESELKQSEEKFRTLFEEIDDGIILIDTHENIYFSNPAASNILEYDSQTLASKKLLDIFNSEDIEIIKKRMSDCTGKSGNRIEVDLDRFDGNSKNLLISISSLTDERNEINGYIFVLNDITEMKKAESEKKILMDRLVNAQRMESLGVLAGGVAHDLNNILGPLIAYPDMIRATLPPGDPIADKIIKIQHSAEKAADIVKDLLTMARRGRYEMKTININNIIKSYLDSPTYLKLVTNNNVNVNIDLDDNIPNISGSESHLYKVIMNLIQNAFEAIDRSGEISVITECKNLEKLPNGFDDIEIGKYIICTIKDSGIGIKKKDIDRIFEPFYSNKKLSNSGSGLGLSVVYSVVKDHSGYIDVISNVNNGTTFYLYFPVVSTEMIRQSAKTIIDVRGNEKILIIDDIYEQRELAETVLKGLGYKTESVENGEKAISFLLKNKVDLVIIDMIMEPGLNGLETYKEIIKIYPRQKAIIVSGFSETDSVKEALKLGVGKFLSKPYTMQKLGKAIREVLSS